LPAAVSSSGRLCWRYRVSEPSGLVVKPSVVLPMLEWPCVARFQNAETGGVWRAGKSNL
jgi:hypothetical protein